MRKMSKFIALRRDTCMTSWLKLIYDFISFSLNVSQGNEKLIAWCSRDGGGMKKRGCALLDAKWTAGIFVGLTR